MVPTAETFKNDLDAMFSTAKKKGEQYIDVTSGELHTCVGGYPSSNHRMPTCCSVMRQRMKQTDQVLSAPLKGKGAELKVRYYL